MEEREEWGKVYEENRDRLLNRARYRWTRNPSDAEEIVAQTFVDVIPHLKSLGGDPTGYLVRALDNHARDWLRGRGRQELRAVVDEPVMPTPLEADPERSTLLARDQEEVRAALESLAPRHREAVELRELDMLSYGQIRTKMGLANDNAVAQLLFRARRALAEKLRLAQVDVGSLPGTCRKAVLPQLSPYIDGSLPDETRTLIGSHLEGCEPCKAALEDMSEAGRRMRVLAPPVLVASTLRDRVEETLSAIGYFQGKRPGTVSRTLKHWETAPRRKRRIAAAGIVAPVLLALLVFVTPGQDGSWKPVAEGLQNITKPGMARTADGRLHLAWAQAVASVYDHTLWHTAFDADGHVIGSPQAIVTGWFAIGSSVDLVVTADGGLQVFFAGMPTDSLFTPLAGHIVTATADAEGRSWSAPRVANTGGPWTHLSDGIGAVAAKDGMSIVAWGSAGARQDGGFRFVDQGTPAPGSPDGPLTERCCPQMPDVAVDAVTGEVVVAWSLAGIASAGRDGIYAQNVVANRGLSDAQLAPGSVPNDLRRTAISGRIGGDGIYLAYSGKTGVYLWRYGTSEAPLRITDKRGDRIALAAAPGGRLWVIWERDGRYSAARTDSTASSVEKVLSIDRPVKTKFGSSELYADAAGGPLHLVAIMHPSGANDSEGFNAWHIRKAG